MVAPSRLAENCRKEWKQGLAKSFRAKAPEGERRLWLLVRGGQIGRIRFRRQQPIGPYIVDFFCHELELAIEIDGSNHDLKESYDFKRQQEIAFCIYIQYLKPPLIAIF